MTNRVKCPDCGDWVCMTHGGHIGEFCQCAPCDECRDLFPPDELEDELCQHCHFPVEVGLANAYSLGWRPRG